jgi:hypothetical protein
MVFAQQLLVPAHSVPPSGRPKPSQEQTPLLRALDHQRQRQRRPRQRRPWHLAKGEVDLDYLGERLYVVKRRSPGWRPGERLESAQEDTLRTG